MNCKQHFDYTFTIEVIGAPRTGKSFLVKQFISPDIFRCDLSTKKIYLDGLFLKINIFDIPRHTRMLDITIPFYQKSRGFIAIYDVYDAESFGMLIVMVVVFIIILD